MSPPPRRVHPGMYMALGGVLVIAALIGTGFYMRKAEAGTERTGTTEPAKAAATPAPVAAASPAPAPTSSPAEVPAPSTAASAPAETPAALPPPPPSTPEREPTAVTPARTVPARSAAVSAAKAPATGDAAPKRAAQPNAINLDQLEQELDQMSGRVSATNSSLDRLQQEQARMGLGLRADMASRQQSMNLNFSKAQDALEKHDGARAKRFKDLAQSDLEALEHFLGR